MSWLGDKPVYPSAELKNGEGVVEWTKEEGLTLFQHTCIELAKGANHSLAGRYEDEGFGTLIADQARALIQAMQNTQDVARQEDDPDA